MHVSSYRYTFWNWGMHHWLTKESTLYTTKLIGKFHSKHLKYHSTLETKQNKTGRLVKIIIINGNQNKLNNNSSIRISHKKRWGTNARREERGMLRHWDDTHTHIHSSSSVLLVNNTPGAQNNRLIIGPCDGGGGSGSCTKIDNSMTTQLLCGRKSALWWRWGPQKVTLTFTH